MNMQTRLLTVGSDPQTDPAVGEAAQLIRQGRVVALPTETVYGLAGNAADPEAVSRIFAAKQRPEDNPLIVHLAGPEQLDLVSNRVSESARKLAAAFWPGPLTLVLPAAEPFRRTICRSLDTIAVRVPDHPIFLAVIRRSGLVLAAPSANLSGRPSPTTAAHVLDDLNGRIPLVLDGGPCRVGIESTVLDLSGDRPAVLRPGMITADTIGAALGQAPVRFEPGAENRSPGTRYRHYSPDAVVYLVGPAVNQAARSRLWTHLADKKHTGYIGSQALPESLEVEKETPVSTGDLARRLYEILRDMDRRGVTHLVIDAVDESGAGLSLMDRLRRAATHVLLSKEDIDALTT
ncbi:MAG: L-threonylcarbamoyladenylate synthase [Acidobacteriota bacterium]|nr:L-threonylcarbamoyladenylate synthase [Acidobacteriota bacterium]